MSEASVGVLPGRPWLSVQYGSRSSKAIRLLSQCDFEIAAAGRRAEANHPMVFAGDSRGHGEYMPQFDLLFPGIGKWKTLRYIVINRRIEIDLRIVRKLVMAAIIDRKS